MSTSPLLVSPNEADALRKLAATLPTASLDGAQLAALELLLQHALAPLRGFTVDATADQPALPLILEACEFAVGDTICLQDAEGVSLAVLHIDAKRDAQFAGNVRGIELPRRELFVDHRVPHLQLQQAMAAMAAPALCVHLRGHFAGSFSDEQLGEINRHANGGAVALRVLDGGDPDRAHLLKRTLNCALRAQRDNAIEHATVSVSADPHSSTRRLDDNRALDVCYARNIGCENNLWLHGESGPGASATHSDGQGLCVLFTGLSGSGKSTLARALHAWLVTNTDRAVTLLDGDVVRRELSRGLGFSRADRDLNVLRIGYVASQIVLHGGIVICAPIAPYANSRRAVRERIEASGRYVEIHVSTPLQVCEARDRKGLYAKARAGEIAEFTGISDPYETPTDAHLRIDTAQTDIEQALSVITRTLGPPLL